MNGDYYKGYDAGANDARMYLQRTIDELRKDADRYRAIRENLEEFLEHIPKLADPDVVDVVADDLIAFNRPRA